jgi:hypothetical protein
MDKKEKKPNTDINEINKFIDCITKPKECKEGKKK